MALDPPGRKEEGPVDEALGVGDVEVREDHAPRVQRHDGDVVRGAGRTALPAHLDDRDEFARLLPLAVLAAQLLLLLVHLGGETLAVGPQQAGQQLAVLTGVGRVDDRAAVDRGDLQRGVQRRGRCAADDDRDAQAAPLELLADVRHLVERRRDEAAQADALRSPGDGFVDDALRLDHDAQVADLVSVAGHHHRDDVLADVVDVALDRGDEHPSGTVRRRGGALLDVGGEGRHGALHHARRLDDLRQEHLALAEEPAHALHGGHEQRVDHRHRAAQRAVALQRILLDVLRHALEHGVVDALGERPRAPGIRGLRGGVGRLPHLLGIFGQPFGRIGAAAEDHVLDALEQRGLDLVVYLEHLRVDDAHVHAGADRVVEEGRVHRLAHGVVAAEGEREVRDAARDLGVGQVLLDPARCVDEGLGVAVVLGNACGDGQDVGVEDDVLGREAGAGQQAVGPFGHLDLAPEGVGLPPLVEEHHHRGGAVAVDFARPAQELLLALLERDGVDDGLALRHLQPRDERLPARRVDHRRHAGDLRLGGRQVEERAHGRGAVDQPVVHADVDDLRPGVDLCPGDGERLLVVALADEPREAGRAGDVRALADVDEVRLGDDAQRFQTAQYGFVAGLRQQARRVAADDLRQLEDVGRGGAAAAADDVHQAAAHVFAHILGKHLGCLVVAAHDVRQSGVGVGRDACLGHGGEPLEVGQQLPRPVGAVEPHGEQPRMGYRDAEGLDGLSREGAAAGVGQRARDHDGDFAAEPLGQEVDGVERRLGVERVEDRLDEQDVDPAVEKSLRLRRVGVDQLAEGDLARRGVRHVGRHRGRAVRRAHRPGDEARLLRVARRRGVGRRTGHRSGGTGHLAGVGLEPVVAQRDGVGVE